ncbi:dUTP diphosphatase [Sporosarcina sp. FSL K6-1508]|uniref:dUTP diphosphatase n=1 Tax=Sporosarcina sp. FSL K6-1508 TaxID=2921553 RepID=UPI0030F62083
MRNRINLSKFFLKQRALDGAIVREKHLTGRDLFSRKRLALIVELSELANEMPESFKFWSNKQNNYEKALNW